MKVFLKLIFIVWFVGLGSFASANELNLVWERDGFSAPESVIYDERTKLLFVSNVNGGPDQKDGNGFISIMKLDGSLAEFKWVTGLHAPKGMSIIDNRLYVSDIDQLVVINVDNGRIVKRYDGEGAVFLNDIATTTTGDVYVSDMLTNTIYRLSNGEFTPWLESDLLESPNGLYIEGNNMIVGSWGNMTNGFATEVPGHLKRVSIDTRVVESLGDGSPVGNLDGVESDGNSRYYVTDWFNGGLFLVDSTGFSKKILSLNQGSADHEVIAQEKLLLIPMMLENKVISYRIP
jgi:sugar lactone lactonase YvrE